METRGSVPIAFGPVPSRRLGRSLGINNVPPKACSYSCVYCQVGRTPHTEIAPRDFGTAEEMVQAVTRRVLALRGMLRFAQEWSGELVSETMLIRGLNDGDDALAATAAFLERLRPRVAFIAVPTRPPAEPWVRPPDEEAVNRAYQRFAERLPRVELLTGFEGTAFGTSGDAAEDLLAVTAVHPMREDAALALLARAGAERTLLDELVREDALRRVSYQGHTFYVRRLPRIEADEGGSR